MKSKKKIIKIIISVFLIIILFGALGASYLIGNLVFEGSTQLVTNESTATVSSSFWQAYYIDYEKFKSDYKIEKIELKSSLDEHIIPADYIYSKNNKDKNKDTAILVHGLGGNRLNTYPIAQIFLNQGYNVVAYDQRSSGENTAKYTTFGYLESEDLKDYINYVKEENKDNKLIVWGTSFGGATVGIVLGDEKVNEVVDNVILDCPVSNMEYMIKVELEKMNIGIPTDYLLYTGNMVNKMKLGFGYSDADVTKYTSKTTVPILIFNSKIDEVTPYFMGEDIYNSITHNNKKLVTVTDSEHANISLNHREEYEIEILNFISGN
ncbi:MAG: alpha/beta hydrolase [Clostridium sp.]